MFKYVLSLFWKTEDPSGLDIDKAYEIVHDSLKPEPKPVENEYEETKEICADYEIVSKTGKITKIVNDLYTVENLYEFKSELDNLLVGTEISYQLIKTAGILEVVNVHIVRNDWDVFQTGKAKWCNRTILCNVQQREQRLLTLMPGEIKVDLNKVSSEFVPIEGDWLQLDAKCTIDEHVVDLTGDIIEINKLLPLRPQVKIGKVTSYQSEEGWGDIDKKIFFLKEALYCGYIPQITDEVVCEIIESNQGSCTWRALKILPHYLHKKKNGVVKSLSEEEFGELPAGVAVTENIVLNLTKLGEVKTFSIEINNQSEQAVIVANVVFPKKFSQCQIITDVSNHSIPPEGSLVFKCECTAKCVGESSEAFVIEFKELKVRRWITLQVSGDVNKRQQNYIHNNSKNNYSRYKKQPYVEREQRELIKGRNLRMKARFCTIQIPDFMVPQRLFELVAKNLNDIDALQIELERMKPVLTSDFSYMNYEEKFHTLIHLDEINTVLEMRKFDRDQACFVRCGEYMMLEIENLSEKRPSIIVSDKIIARNPRNSTSPDYEGFIHKVGKNHVFLKFSQLFHDTYEGEDYSIRVISSRTTFRRQHYAISLAIRNLGKDFLFPTKVDEKPPQVQFHYDSYSSEQTIEEKVVEIKSPVVSGKQRMLDNIRKYRESNGLAVDVPSSILKLEWYNTSLNIFQKEAVKNILLGVCRPLPYIIFGPPGTGKTVTLVEATLQILRMIPHSRILLSAPSNSAADLIAMRLIDTGVLKPGDLVRLVAMSAVDSIPPRLAPFCATANKEREGTESSQPIITNSGLTLGCSSSVLGRHRITVTTCSSAGLLFSSQFTKGHFTHVIVDEAAQTDEPSVMIPLSFLDTHTGQAILAGDPMQLGPVILSYFARHFGLEQSFLERLINRFPYAKDPHAFESTCGYDPRLLTKLIYNYRSLPSLLKLPSKIFYSDDLLPTLSEEDSDEANLLKKLKPTLPVLKDGELPTIVFHGVLGENFQPEDSPSWCNPSEAAQVFYYTNELYRLGLTASDVAIITPYKAQTSKFIELFKEAEFSLPKLGTVEDFQGQEFNVVLLSTVRSCKNHVRADIKQKLGFVSNPRRLNVSITRAKVLLIIVGNPNLLSIDRYWRSVIQHCVNVGSYVGCPLS